MKINICTPNKIHGTYGFEIIDGLNLSSKILDFLMQYKEFKPFKQGFSDKWLYVEFLNMNSEDDILKIGEKLMDHFHLDDSILNIE